MPYDFEEAWEDRYANPISKELAIALQCIYEEVITRVATRNRTKLFQYEDLAGIAGTVEDWQCGGRFRDALSSLNARRWLQKEFKMHWRSRATKHGPLGLEFTCDQLTGGYWDQERAADIALRYGEYIAETAQRAEELMPRFRDHFRRLRKAGLGMVSAGKKMVEASGARRMRMLGVVIHDDDDPPGHHEAA